MRVELLEKVCEAWNLGSYVKITPVDIGVLNENYVLTTTKGIFFIKSVRGKKQSSVPKIHEVEHYMRTQNIPSICMLQNKYGNIFIQEGEQMITIYPYIENTPRTDYSAQDYFAFGKMLGKIHKAGTEATDPRLYIKHASIPDTHDRYQQLEKYKEVITNKVTKTTDDILFTQYIELKLHNLKIQQKPTSAYTPTLLHGDYHLRNILFGKDGEILGVCDWEKTIHGSKALELMRAILYGQLQHRATIENLEIENHYVILIEATMQGYASAYPLRYEEIMEGYDLLAYSLCLQTWMEKFYYDENNARANIFLKNALNHIPMMYQSNLRSIIGELTKKYSSNKPLAKPCNVLI